MNQDEPSAVINIDAELIGRHDAAAVAAFAADMIQAVSYAYASNQVTYVAIDGEVIASVNPPEAGERYEHAAEVMVEARQHVAAVPVRAERRRRFRVWSPFEGVF